MYHVLMFIYIFNFRLLKTTNLSSTVIVTAVILGVYLILNKQFLNYYFKCLISKYNVGILSWGGLSVLLMTFTTVFHEIYDFSLIRIMLNQLFIIEVGILLISFYEYKGKQPQILDLLIDVFIIQALIQSLSILSGRFREITNVFRDDMVIYYSIRDYGGSRGVAISGAAFFGLAVAYGIMFTVIVYHWKYWKYKALSTRIALVGVLLIGAISAGRTAIIGFGIATIYFIANNLKRITFMSSRKNIRNSLLLLFGLFLGVLVIHFQKNEYSIKIFVEYSMEFVNNFLNGKGLTSSSTQNLFHGMYFPLTLKQFLIGDGQYMDGSLYYMHTDAGYMRMILYFGIGGIILLCIYQLQILKVDSKTKQENLLFGCIIIMLLIFQIKGDVVGVLHILQAILIVLHSGIHIHVKNAEKINFIHGG